jgi:WD40 repeat protein/serine/threonine protein kinase
MEPLLPALPEGRIKHYELIRRLGEGGMGTVFLARDTRLARLVAIKILRAGAATDSATLLVEARATARCKHENIVVVHEIDEVSGVTYMVLEHLEGRTLRARMNELPADIHATEARRVSALLLPVVRALCVAHDQGIIHRDLKPENIFLADSGVVKVLDFGIAARREDLAVLRDDGDDGVNRPRGLFGTRPYMSPEQWRAEPVDGRADIWAIGVMLYEICAGELPVPRVRFDQIRELDIPMPKLAERRPDLGSLGAVVDRCLLKPRELRCASAKELLERLESALGAPQMTASVSESDAPFPGLAALQESDAAQFFGRDYEVGSLVAALANQPWISITGPTGAGKSSVVRAGVIPTLKRAGGWETITLRPGPRPLAALEEVLSRSGEVTARLYEEPGVFGARLRSHARATGTRILLFVDQLEELFTLTEDKATRATFLACLFGFADDASSPLRLMVSIRSDFLDRLSEHADILPEIARGLWFLPRLKRAGLREALTRPIEDRRYAFDDTSVVEEMLDALEAAANPLLLLQFTAGKLWEARDRGKGLLTRQSYEALGGVEGALSTHGAAVLSVLSPADQRMCRAILLRLVTKDRTRAVVQLSDFVPQAGDIVRRLAAAGLVSMEKSAAAGEGVLVELAHESLIERLPQLKRWIDESRSDSVFLERLRGAAANWEARGREEGLLWRDEAAQEARLFLARNATPLVDREEQYLKAVVRFAEGQRKRKNALIGGSLALLMLVGVALSYLGLRARHEAARADEALVVTQREARTARNATRLAVARELSFDPTTAIALLREVEPPDVPRGWADLATEALKRGVASRVLIHPDRVTSAIFSPSGGGILTTSFDRELRSWGGAGHGDAPVIRSGHEGWIVAATLSKDGSRVATASWDGTVRVWGTAGAEPPLVLTHGSQVNSVDFSTDGRRLVTAADDGNVRVWRLDTKERPLVLEGHAGRLESAKLSPDGTWIAFGGQDSAVHLIRADGTGAPTLLRGHNDLIFSVAFSPDGEHIASGSKDKSIRIWRTAGGDPLVLRGHEDGVMAVVFSPDGKRLASASSDKTARIWSADGLSEPVVLRGHEAEVQSASWSRDGKSVVTASWDKTARVWSAEPRADVPVVHTLPGMAFSARFDATGHRFSVTSDDNRARLCELDAATLGWVSSCTTYSGHEGWVFSSELSPDGARLLTASADGTARIWSVATHQPLTVLKGHADWVVEATYNPRGDRVLTVGRDGTAKIWRDGVEERLLEGHGGALTSGAWSPDGDWVATSSTDGTVRVWSVTSTAQPRVFRGHSAEVLRVAWSSDGARLASASADKTLHIFRADGTGDVRVLRGHDDEVRGVAWSPDGAWIASCSGDKTVRLWSATDGADLLVLRGHDSAVDTVTWSPAGDKLISASWDKTVRIWSDFSTVVGPDDARLWSSTQYCLSVPFRVARLGESEAAARDAEARCQHLVSVTAP